MTRGFSLIETIVYIALLAIVMAGAILTSYEILQSSYLVAGRNATQEEGHFVLRKIEHALSGAADLSASGSSLTIDPYAGSNITLELSGGAVVLDSTPLTTNNVTVNSLVFTEHAGPPKGVTITLTLDGEVFTLTKYVR